MLLLFVGLILCGATVSLIARAIMLPRLRAVANLEQVSAYGFPVSVRSREEAGGVAEALDRLADRIGGAFLPRVDSEEQAAVRKLLIAAGAYGTTPGRFLGYRVLSAFAFTLGWLWLGPVANLATALFVLLIPTMALTGWMVPLSLLRLRSQRRLEQIDYELPELIDSLVVTVEAGVGFNSALRFAARDLHGPLGGEINLTLQEQSMGLGANEALQNLAKRVELASIQSFVRSVLQGESLGVSIGDILRGLAVEMRARRRAKAEERAHKAPIKMLFPLAFCIFPAIMIVLLFPAIRDFTSALGG